MENSIRVENTVTVYDVSFDNITYELQADGNSGMILGMFREDGQEIPKEDREAVRDFFYEYLRK